MSLLKAISKTVLRSINDYVYNEDINHAKQMAFNSTGLNIKNAKKNGCFINGKSTYKKILSSQMLKAKNKHINRDKFINDL